MSNANKKGHLGMKPEVRQIFEDLEAYLQFCRDYGYVYNEKDLYHERSNAYGEFIKMTKGREPWDQWRSPRKERKFDFNRVRH